ncbi:MAG TPA: hypothetical protein ACQGQH_01680 [Xylella sp.]
MLPRFRLGDYWLEQRKGSTMWYRAWRDVAGCKQRASLGTRNFSEAKVALAKWFVQHATLQNQLPNNVLLSTVLTRYMTQHGNELASKDTAQRGVDLWNEFFDNSTSVADITITRQEDFLK